MLLRIGSTLAATVMLAVMGTALVLWGINILPNQPMRVGFIALVVAVCLVALRSIASDPRVMRQYHTRARPAQVSEPMLVTIPAISPVGMCWQCGSHVREENTVCWKCGATQPQQRDLPPPIIPGKETAWDRSETIYRVPEPDVLPTGSLPVYQVDVPDGWSDVNASASFALPPAEKERLLPTPLLAPVQSAESGQIDEASGGEWPVERESQRLAQEPQQLVASGDVENAATPSETA